MAERDRVGGGLSDPGWMARVMEETWRRFPEVATDLAHPSPVLRAAQPAAVLTAGDRGARPRARAASPGGAHRRAHPRPLPGARAARRRRRRRCAAPRASAVSRSATGGSPPARSSSRSGLLVPQRLAGLRRRHGRRLPHGRGGRRAPLGHGVLQLLRDRPQGLRRWTRTASTAPRPSRTPTARSSPSAGRAPIGAVGPHPWEASLARAALRGPVFSILDRAARGRRARPCARPCRTSSWRSTGWASTRSAGASRSASSRRGPCAAPAACARPTNRAGRASPASRRPGHPVARADRRRGERRGRGQRRVHDRVGDVVGAGRGGARRPGSRRRADRCAAPGASACGRPAARDRRTSGARSRARCRRTPCRSRSTPCGAARACGGRRSRSTGSGTRRRARCAGPTPAARSARGRRRRCSRRRAGRSPGALARAESRGMHVRDDMPATNDALAVRIVLDGLDEVAVSDEPLGVTA